jgi:2-polyprenyl-3-methyl-5-hydroxy-6-metoxy-1,4-benzoquinol methylase
VTERTAGQEQETVTITTADWGSVAVAGVDLDALQEVTGMSREECVDRLRATRRFDVAREWRAQRPSTFDEILSFYSRTDKYIWELLLWNATDDYRRSYEHVIDRLAQLWPSSKYPRALDYGAGIGSVALRLAEHGYAVTIADVPGHTLSFADVRLRRRGVEHEVLSVTEQKPDLTGRRWDVAVCFDVLEHVPRPDRLCRALLNSVEAGGAAALIADFESTGPDYPQHLPEPRRRFRDHRWPAFLAGLGLSRVDRSLYRKNNAATRFLMRLRYAIWRSTGLYVSRLER